MSSSIFNIFDLLFNQQANIIYYTCLFMGATLPFIHSFSIQPADLHHCRAHCDRKQLDNWSLPNVFNYGEMDLWLDTFKNQNSCCMCLLQHRDSDVSAALTVGEVLLPCRMCRFMLGAMSGRWSWGEL